MVQITEDQLIWTYIISSSNSQVNLSMVKSFVHVVLFTLPWLVSVHSQSCIGLGIVFDNNERDCLSTPSLKQ